MYDLIDVSAFKKLLLDCATALQDGNLKLADVHLGMISNLLAKKTDIARSRLVKYYAEGIVRRAYGLHPSLPFFTSRLPYFDKIEPNVLEGKKQLHLIDFYLPHLYSHHFYGPYLFDTLRKVCGDSISVRVSVVLPPFMEKTVDFRREEQFLAREAEKESIKLKDFKMVYANGLGEVDDAFMWDLMMKRRADDDEALVIFYSNKLHRLVAEEGALETELLTLAQINPDVVFISEDNANHNYSNFIQRLDHSFPYYFSTNPVIGIEAQNMKRREIGNIVGCEGKDLVERHLTFDQWRSLFLSTGFMIPIPLYVKGYNGKENGCLVYRDEFHSAWKFCSGVHLDSTSFNSLLRDFNPIPSLEDTVQPIPVLKEHSSLNRLAAFAEIYDILEDMCLKYEIPLALTWVCGSNRTVSDSYKKLTLSLESTSSYYIRESYWFMKRCIGHNLEEGQGIAGKALQSNEPFLFEPDITLLEEPDYPFATDASFFGSHAAAAICLQNNYTDNIYVIEFFIPPSEKKFMTQKSLASCIFSVLNNVKKRFVTLRNHGSTKVDSKKEANIISNINQHVTMPMRSSLPASYEDEMRNALPPFNHNQQWGETSNSNSVDVQAAISFPFLHGYAFSLLNGMAPINAPILMPYYGVQQTQGPHAPLENADHTSFEPIGNNEIALVNEADLENELPLSSAKKRKLTSNVWDEFYKEKDPKDGKAKVWAICSHCKRRFDGSSKKGTTHLRNHLNRCKSRGIKVMKDPELILPRRGSEHQSVGEGNNNSFDLDRSRMDVARMVIKHQYPLNIVEHEFFSILLKNLQPMFKLQSQEALSSDILWVYKEEKCKLIEYFDRLSCRLNLTISLWTDDLEKVTYSCFAVQFVDDNWALKKKIIAFKSLGHGNEFEPTIFLETFESLLAEWEFDKKLCSLTMQNFASSSLEIDEEIRKSWHRFEASYPLSTFYISFDGSISDLLTKYKLSELKANATKSPSACLLQDISNIYKKQSQQEKDYPLMNVKYDNNWKMCSLVLAIAAILDPRFKFEFVEFLYEEIYGNNSARIHLTKIRSALTEIFDDYASNFCNGKSDLLDDTNSLASLNAEENMINSFQRWRKVTTNKASWKLELDKYLQKEPEPLISSQMDQFEVLSWWGEHASEFPILGRIARDILAIPMSIVLQGSSLDEKVMMDNPIFKGLDPQIIEAMICGKDWLESPKESVAGLASSNSAVESAMRENNASPPHPSELDHLSSKSDKEVPSLPKESLGNQAIPAWSEKDVRTYLTSPLTTEDVECLSKWQSHQIREVEVGPDKILDKELAPLLLIPSSVDLQNPEQYYIDDTVVNHFFVLLKRRYEKFPHKYLKHHSFDSAVATILIRDKTRDLSSWVKREDLEGTNKVFLPICLNKHWLLFCANMDNKNLLWLDSIGYSQLTYAYQKEVICNWFLNFVLPIMGYNQPYDWSYISTKVPLQKNSVDCGLFVMKYADCLTLGNYFPFNQEDVPHFRRRTFLDLIYGEIHSV